MNYSRMFGIIFFFFAVLPCARANTLSDNFDHTLMTESPWGYPFSFCYSAGYANQKYWFFDIYDRREMRIDELSAVARILFVTVAGSHSSTAFKWLGNDNDDYYSDDFRYRNYELSVLLGGGADPKNQFGGLCLSYSRNEVFNRGMRGTTEQYDALIYWGRGTSREYSTLNPGMQLMNGIYGSFSVQYGFFYARHVVEHDTDKLLLPQNVYIDPERRTGYAGIQAGFKLQLGFYGFIGSVSVNGGEGWNWDRSTDEVVISDMGFWKWVYGLSWYPVHQVKMYVSYTAERYRTDYDFENTATRRGNSANIIRLDKIARWGAAVSL